MNPDESDPLTSRIIGAAIAVHRELGPGYIEKIYEEALALALVEAEVQFSRQVSVAVDFHGQSVGEHRLDLLVDGCVVVELKAIQAFEPIHYAIVRSYVKATGARCGLILNFAGPTLQVKRIGPKQKGPDAPAQPSQDP